MAEKRFEATVKRLEKARNSGKNGKSSFFTQSLVLIILLISTGYIFEPIFLTLKKVLEYSTTHGQNDLLSCFFQVFNIFVKFIGSCLMFAAVLATFSDGLQVGFGIKPNLLTPSLSKISPNSYLKNITQNLKKYLFYFLSVLFLLVSVAFILNKNIKLFCNVLTLTPFNKLLFIRSNLLMLYWITLFIFLLFALIDILLSRKKFRKDTMMSLDELKEEIKENEGSPEMKSARAQAHQALLYEEIVKRVRRSRFIVVCKNKGERYG